MKQVTFLLLGILLMGSSHDCISQTPITDSNIHEAVDLWVSNPKAAEATYGHISDWDTSNVTDMSSLFYDREYFNEDISGWDVSNVTDMSRMFSNAWSFNYPIGNWDVSHVTDMAEMFAGADNFEGLILRFNQPIGNWDVSNVKNMTGMFVNCQFNQPIGDWDVGSVTNMSDMFKSGYYIINFFNHPIGDWDVSNVTNMSRMFLNSSYNHPLEEWDVSSVTNMSRMFNDSRFNHPIEDWDVSSVTNMSGMFLSDALTAFNQPIGGWDVSSVTDMSLMFAGENKFNQDISNWNVSSVSDLSWFMSSTNSFSIENYDKLLISWSKQALQHNVSFSAGGTRYCTGEAARASIIETYGWIINDRGKDEDCALLTPITDSNIHEAVNLWISNPSAAEEKFGHISNWDTSKVTNMSGLFEGKFLFNDDISNWDVSSVRNMSRMFHGKNWEISSDDNLMVFNQPIGKWDVSNVRNMSEMFAASAFRQPIGNWDVSSVINMSGMFHDARLFNQPIGNWDVSNVIDMHNMFHYARGFNQPIGNWDVSSVTDMSEMFRGLWDDDPMNFNQPIGNWDVSNVKNMSGMFASATYFNQSIENWDVSSVKNMSGMFLDATYFNKPIGNWDVSGVTNLSSMFHTALSFNQPIENWKLSKVTDMRYMFYDAIRFNQTIANWDVSNVSDMTDMFYYANSFSTENYDKLLIGWARQSLQPNVSFGAGATRYCNGEAARASIIETYGWTITDGGKDKDCIKKVNCLTVEDNIGFAGGTSDINLTLKSSERIKGFQFDITFPDGFVFDPLDLTKTELPTNFQVSCAAIGGNAYRVIGFSLTNETIPCGKKSILSFPTFINEETLEDDYPIPVTNVILSDVDNLDITCHCPLDGVITVYNHPLGDANGDYDVNVLDILATIDYIFGNPPSPFYFDLADVNFDATIDVFDVLGIQDIILNPSSKTSSGKTKESTASALSQSNYLFVDSQALSPSSSETLAFNLSNNDVVKGLQFDFVLPEGITFNPKEIIGTSRLDGFIIKAQEVSKNTYKVIIFSLSSATITSGTRAILELPVFIDSEINNGVYPMAFTDVKISETNNKNVATTPPNVGNITIGTLGVDTLEKAKDKIKVFPNPVKNLLHMSSELEGYYQMYDLQGRYVGKGNVLIGNNEVDTSMLQSGLYMIKISTANSTVIMKFIKE
ncbi:BspA family leucine-rich repeat surface protein [Algibacter mikhailovii]|uniref:BspA family leucine-rich repeat surface protein n=1 Tax=Algibacter mikhailovii TaxID=425498 RepID=UPI0024956DAF|nr:BspA family leucine-rich repeat surface protein [Algibacter mikhailovii]